MATEGYKPTSGMQSAARRAIKLKEEGKAKGAGTMVGWTRAGQLARGETLSLSTVKRMYSFFSRHEVDKKGKDFNNTENPSNGKIMWLACPIGTILLFFANHCAPASHDAKPFFVEAATKCTTPASAKHPETNIAHHGW